jgi:hypothetical protein
VANRAVVVAIAIIVHTLSFGTFPSRLPEITEPIRHLANIPTNKK